LPSPTPGNAAIAASRFNAEMLARFGLAAVIQG